MSGNRSGGVRTLIRKVRVVKVGKRKIEETVKIAKKCKKSVDKEKVEC